MYFTTIGAPTTKPHTGFGDWNQDFPNPWDFMQLFAGNAGSSLNYGYVNDPHYNTQIAKLSAVAPEGVASQWQALDQYAVNTPTTPCSATRARRSSTPDKLNFQTGTMSVEYQTDLTSLELK